MLKKDKELRILVLTHAYSDVISGGETKAAWEMTNALAKRGIKIYVVTTFVKIDETVPHSNIKIYKVPFCKQARNFNKLDMFKTFFYSLPVIFVKKIDIIHLINTQGPHPFAYFKIRPFVSTVDMSWNYEDPRFKDELFYDRNLKKEEFNLADQKYNFLDRILNRISNLFFRIFKLNELLPKSVDLCAYRHAKLLNKLKSKGYKSQFVYIPVGADTDRFNPSVGPIFNKKDNIVFLFIGTIAKRKGVEYLIRSFNVLSRKYKNIELLLVGPGAPSTVSLFKKITEPTVKISFIGELSTDDLVRYINYADVFVSPMIGLDLGINKSVAEAMSCAKPIIVNKAHDTEILNKEVGFCIEPGEVKPLVKAMEKFVKNPQIIDEMGEKARNFILKHHSWSILAERMEKSYRKLLI